jgi:hypothetical protein
LGQITALAGSGTILTRRLRESSKQPQDLLDEESSAPILLCVAMAPVSPLFQKLRHF